MPYIKTTTNTPIPKEKREAIKDGLERDVSILGQGEWWLMVDFCENSPLYFRDSNAPAAIVSVDLFGATGKNAYTSMTKAVTDLISQELSINADRIFVKYGEHPYWGWNGSNF